MPEKDVYYFSHDADAQDDPKIMVLIDQLQMEGYGIYWALIEKLRSAPEYKLPFSVCSSYAKRWSTSKQKVESVIQLFGLFVSENGMFYSASLKRRMEKKSEKARESALKRWGKDSISDASALQTQSERNAIGMRNDAIKGKERESKEKVKSIESNPPDSPIPLSVPKNPKKPSGGNKTFVAPTLEEVKSYFLENGFSNELGERAFKYYDSANWYDSEGKKIKSWKQKMQGVWFRDSNRTKPQSQTVVNTLTHLPNAKTIVDKYG